MTAELHGDAGEDPAEILRVLPAESREQFLQEYRSALDAAHEVWRYRQLRDVLHLWRLRAQAYANPDFASAAQAARDDRSEEFIPAEQVIPGWSDRG